MNSEARLAPFRGGNAYVGEGVSEGAWWWEKLGPRRRAAWGPLLGVMTLEERREFHDERCAVGDTLREAESTPASFRESALRPLDAERALYAAWRARLGPRAARTSEALPDDVSADDAPTANRVAAQAGGVA